MTSYSRLYINILLSSISMQIYCLTPLTSMIFYHISTQLFWALLVLCFVTRLDPHATLYDNEPNSPISITDTSWSHRFHLKIGPIHTVLSPYLKAIDMCQSPIPSDDCTFMSNINVTVLDETFHQITQMGVYETETCLAQMGVYKTKICLAHMGIDINMCMVNIAKFQSSNTYIRHILSGFVQFMLLFQKACKNQNWSTFNFYLVYCCLKKNMSISKKCKIIQMSLMRSLYNCHDYKIHLEAILCMYLLTVIFILGCCIRFFIAVFDNYFEKHYLFTSFNEDSIDQNYEYIIQDNKSDNTDDTIVSSSNYDVGGGRKPIFTYELLHQYVNPVSDIEYKPDTSFTFLSHCPKSVAVDLCKQNQKYIFGCVPLLIFLPLLTRHDVKEICKLHNLNLSYRANLSQMNDLLSNHYCNYCETYASVFEIYSTQSKAKINKTFYEKEKSKPQHMKNETTEDNGNTIFPPPSPSHELQENIIHDYCKDCSPTNILESGCAVCGQLTPCKNLSKLSTTTCSLHILSRSGCGFTRKERTTDSAPIEELPGPVLDSTCKNICMSCKQFLQKGRTPTYALAKGLWLGNIPLQLQNLSFAEQLLIARVRHNKCIVRVSSGMHKMKANAIMFENPTPKIYRALPPSIEELDDVLAFIFTGPTRPTDDDMKRTPLLVHRRKVCSALEWLKLNHVDYYDLDISYDNLKEYPENGCPVVVAYRHAETNKNAESTSAFDQDYEDGTEDGPCPFVVNGITGEELEINNPKALIARATKHL